MTSSSSPGNRRDLPPRGVHDDVADLLGMTPADIRRAVSTLKEDGRMDPAPEPRHVAPAPAPVTRRPAADDLWAVFEPKPRLVPPRGARRRRRAVAAIPATPPIKVETVPVTELLREYTEEGFIAPVRVPPLDVERAEAMGCPGCQRHGMMARALAHPQRPEALRTFAFCKRCDGALEI